MLLSYCLSSPPPAIGRGCCPTAYLVNQCADTAGLQAVAAGTTSKRGMGAWCVCVTQTQTQTPTAHLWVKQLRVDAALSTRKRAPLCKGACIHSTGFCAIWDCITSSSSSSRVSLSFESALPCSGRRCVCAYVSHVSVGAQHHVPALAVYEGEYECKESF